jgi:hypothetical protein
MRGRSIVTLALLALCLSANAARADEIVLKDGGKITGTIVGFENDSFRVETSYGFALVRKDKVADITISAPKKESEPKAKSGGAASAAMPAVVPMPTAAPAVVKEPVSPAAPSPEAGVGAPTPPAKGEPGAAKSKAVATAAPASSLATTPAAPPAPSAPPPAPEPPVIRDEIRGNLYVNLTYGFQMYRPPSWDLIPGARKALPDAVAALGTSDQTTLLVIGRAHAKDPLDAHAAATGKALGEVYENYRVISTRKASVAGFPAVEQRSRGTADGHDWSVLLTTFYKGEDAFTLLGMTWANSDLIQVQENVVAKTVNSLTFGQ